MAYERISEVAANHSVEETTRALKCLMIYDERQAASRAMNFLSGLSRRFESELEFHVDLWRLDILGLPETEEASVAAMAGADLVVLSLRGDIELHNRAKNWLSTGLTRKESEGAGLIALLADHQNLNGIKGPTHRFLQSVADRRFIDVFFHGMEGCRA